MRLTIEASDVQRWLRGDYWGAALESPFWTDHGLVTVEVRFCRADEKGVGRLTELDKTLRKAPNDE